ncbi:hypothetical protein AMAG_06300 [Allomyces macrogynus ATCC 38327]|uniref:Vacuolar protein 8 n=1 Tax=Allomyces macrogynus (strain ATCC 38327) TaxID=578462 RepID=A0A0L0SGK0_ALLM3|nr:hypothetical protein, variant [Allomyces macrogynus ATCC 38327]KNE61480.1 hypothetical protein AMAG_06300 [Allomyces macrogynus ATCC 38327]|eukprot:KNE61479.1 hypothetical protein, variant [Allomyces macrogynus ATCC 38327]
MGVTSSQVETLAPPPPEPVASTAWTCCGLTACCPSLSRDDRSRKLYDQLATDPREAERNAIAEVFSYVESLPFFADYAGATGPLLEHPPSDFFQGELLEVLNVLQSDATDIPSGRAAALILANVTEREPLVVNETVVDILTSLLGFEDDEVQRAASAALGNLAVVAENKPSIVTDDIVLRLLALTESQSIEVQCNAVGCITNFLTDDETKSHITTPALVTSLISLTQADDVRVARNATGALLNLTHSATHRAMLVEPDVDALHETGAEPAVDALAALIDLLRRHQDPEVVYYATTAVSNLAVDASTRARLTDFDRYASLTPTLVGHLSPPTPLRLQTQAALALRNLASATVFQNLIVHSSALSVLIAHARSEYPPLRLAAAACLRNLSICDALPARLASLGLQDTFVNVLLALVSDRGIVQSNLVKQLLVTDGTVLTRQVTDEIRLHAASTLRNLAAADRDYKVRILRLGALDTFRRVLLMPASSGMPPETPTRTNSLVVAETTPLLGALVEDPGPAGDAMDPEVYIVNAAVQCEIGAAMAVLATDDKCRAEMLHPAQGHVVPLLEYLCRIPPSLAVAMHDDGNRDLDALMPDSLDPDMEGSIEVLANGVAALANLAQRPTDIESLAHALVGSLYRPPSPLGHGHPHRSILRNSTASSHGSSTTAASTTPMSPLVAALAALLRFDDWTLRHLALHAIVQLLDLGDVRILRALRPLLPLLPHAAPPAPPSLPGAAPGAGGRRASASSGSTLRVPSRAADRPKSAGAEPAAANGDNSAQQQQPAEFEVMVASGSVPPSGEASAEDLHADEPAAAAQRQAQAQAQAEADAAANRSSHYSVASQMNEVRRLTERIRAIYDLV